MKFDIKLNRMYYINFPDGSRDMAVIRSIPGPLKKKICKLWVQRPGCTRFLSYTQGTKRHVIRYGYIDYQCIDSTGIFGGYLNDCYQKALEL